jgi:hypothetical protein
MDLFHISLHKVKEITTNDHLKKDLHKAFSSAFSKSKATPRETTKPLLFL